MQVRMGGRIHARACRVVGSGPVLAVIVQVAEQVKMRLPAGWARIERFAAGKLHTRNHKVQLVMPGMNMPHPKDIALIRLQSGKGQSLKIVHNPLLLFRRHRIVGVPRQRSGGETPLGVQRVDERPRHLRVAAQHIRQMGVSSGVVLAHKVVGRPFASALTVREDFHVHGASSDAGGGPTEDGEAVPVGESSSPTGIESRDVSALIAFSRLTRAVSTSRASARLLWMLAQRASWLRFAPMRASCRTRSFSRGVCRKR